MNGTTLFEAVSNSHVSDSNVGITTWQNPGTRTNPFDRPPPLKIPITITNDFGKNAWTSNRAIWQTNGPVPSRTSDVLVNRRTQYLEHQDSLHADVLTAGPLRQKSNSSIKFARSSNGAALSPLDNPRVTGIPNGHPWSSSNVSPLNKRQQGQLTSPAKHKRQAWPFPDDLDFDSENSHLLRGSAPDIDPMEEPITRNDFQIDERSNFSGQNGGDDRSFFNPQNVMLLHPANTNAFSNGSVINSRMGPNRQSHGLPLPADISPTSRQYGMATSYANGAQFTSPTSTKFGRGPRRESYSNGAQQQGNEMADAIDSMRSMTLNGHASRPQNRRGGSDPFKSSEYGPVQSSQLRMNGGTPHSRLNVEHEEFRPSGTSNSFDLADDPTGLSQYPSMWAYSGRGTPYSGDFRNNAHGQFYSAGVTPPTGPESGQSAGGSGISSRTSHHDFSVVDRKLGNLDAFQQNPFYQSHGHVNTPAHDFSLMPSVRMNPLAGAYTPYSMAGLSVSSIGPYSPTPRMPVREQEPPVIRSPLLEDFRMNSKTNKRYELHDIFNHVVEFSGDQHGSRFIQQKLETANSDEKDQIFKEIQSNCLQLMTDVFGNYVIQKLFEHGNQSQKKVLANHMKGHVLTLSMQMYGCRVVQKALEHVLTDQQASMVKELDGANKHILKVIQDQNGNHVVQKAIERVPAEHIQFIIEAHKGQVVKLAGHTYGCRVIQRILENCQPAAKRIILDELHGCVAPLITDSFGNYVVQHIIEKGEADDRRVVVSIVQQQILHFSKHKFASNVVEKCILNADEDQRADIFRRLVGPNEQGQTPVLGLLRDQYGNYVIRKSTLLPLPVSQLTFCTEKVHSLLKGAELEALVNEMKLCLPQLKRTSYGKQVMAIEKLLFGVNNSVSANIANRSSTLPATNSGNVDIMGTPPQLHISQHTFQQPLVLPGLSTFSPQ